MTGEKILDHRRTDLTADDARDLVESIRADVAALGAAIRQAWEGRAWKALGYPTWDHMCRAEFGGVPKLPPGERQEVVRELSGAGMSSRAIGSGLGVGEATVRRDRSTAPNDAVDPDATVLSLDGRRRPAHMPRPEREAPEPDPEAEAAFAATVRQGQREAAARRTFEGCRNYASDLASLSAGDLAAVTDHLDLTMLRGILGDAAAHLDRVADAREANRDAR